ncbi:hypothetical protein DL95DRAFT_400428 [Leptodontidium sp. 2 PMI_412]|nr:hypothetical protein DL95DRAFT_400428 [Leptodontidium sp. 2 PMI_412]
MSAFKAATCQNSQILRPFLSFHLLLGLDVLHERARQNLTCNLNCTSVVYQERLQRGDFFRLLLPRTSIEVGIPTRHEHQIHRLQRVSRDSRNSRNGIYAMPRRKADTEMNMNSSNQQSRKSSSPDQKFYDCEEPDDLYENVRSSASPSVLSVNDTVGGIITQSSHLTPASSHSVHSLSSKSSKMKPKGNPRRTCSPDLRNLPSTSFLNPHNPSSSRSTRNPSEIQLDTDDEDDCPIIRHLMLCDNCGELGHR